MRVELVPRRNPVVAGEDQFQAAADADTVDRRHDGHRQLLDPLEQRIDRLQAVDHLLLGFEAFEFADIGADDEAALLARHDDEAAHIVGVNFGFDALDDRVQLFDRAAAECVGALPFPVEDRPRDAFAVDRKAPVLQLSCHFSHYLPQTICRTCRRRSHRTYSAAKASLPRRLWPSVT